MEFDRTLMNEGNTGSARNSAAENVQYTLPRPNASGSAVSPLAERFDNITSHGKPVQNISGKALGAAEGGMYEMDDPPAKQRHSRTSSTSHRRRPSSVSISAAAAPALRTGFAPSVTSQSPYASPATDRDAASYSPYEPPVYTNAASDALVTPPGVSPSSYQSAKQEDDAQYLSRDDCSNDPVKDRLAGFTFGTKAVATGLQSSSSRHSASMRGLAKSRMHTPVSSISSSSRPLTLLSDTSRPPSLLVTRPSQSAGSAFALALDPHPQTSSPPPSTSRVRKHSHTRSNSISLPNLKLGRPASLGLSPAQSFPPSPVSPDENTPPAPAATRVTTGRKLKFEPSGRGAEAEKQKEESRRRALEKLTGVTASADGKERGGIEFGGLKMETIALPDEEEVSTPSLLDKLVEASHLNTGGQTSPELLSWRSLSSPAASTPPLASPLPAETTPSSSQWSFVKSSPAFRDDTLGFDLGSTPKRVSVTSGLGVLAEEDESEASQEISGVAVGGAVEEDFGVKPTPSRLRQLHLLSSPVGDSPLRPSPASRRADLSADGDDSFTSSLTPTNLARSPLQQGSDLNDRQPASALSPTTTGDVPSASTPHRRRQSRGSLSYKRTPQNHDEVRSSGTLSVDDVITPLPTSFNLPSSSHSSLQGWLGNSASSHGQPWPGWSNLTSTPRWSAPTAPITSASSSQTHSPRRDDSDSLNWQNSSIDMAQQRDALSENLEMWRGRCLAAEEKLEAERRERAVLQTRIRKLGDRLSSVSSVASPARHESTISTELRQQLFSTASQLDRERREKMDALARVAELERRLAQLAPPSATAPLLPSQRSHDIYGSYESEPEAPQMSNPLENPALDVSLTDSSLVSPVSPTQDPNLNRIKAWGFPPPPREKSPPKDRKRESFFGLSAAVTPSIERGGFAGIDLPPFVLPAEDTNSLDMPLSLSVAHSSTTAPPCHDFDEATRHLDPAAVHTASPTRTCHTTTTLDLSYACKCCTGDVFDL